MQTAGHEVYVNQRHKFPNLFRLIQYHKLNSGGMSDCVVVIMYVNITSGLAVRLRLAAKEALAPTLEPSAWEIDQSQLTVGRQLGSGQVRRN